MAYRDFREALPTTGGATAPTAPESVAKKPAAKRRRTSFLAIGVVALIVGLIFTLALVTLRQPLTALLVTILILLPGASLFGGDKRR